MTDSANSVHTIVFRQWLWFRLDGTIMSKINVP